MRIKNWKGRNSSSSWNHRINRLAKNNNKTNFLLVILVFIIIILTIVITALICKDREVKATTTAQTTAITTQDTTIETSNDEESDGDDNYAYEDDYLFPAVDEYISMINNSDIVRSGAIYKISYFSDNSNSFNAYLKIGKCQHSNCYRRIA